MLELKKSPLFHLFSAEEIERFLLYFNISGMEKDEKLFSDGGPIDAFYLVIEGSLCAQKENNGSVVELMYFNSGAWVGEGYIFEAGGSEYDVIAKTNCTLMKIDNEGLQDIFTNSPHLYGIFATNLLRHEHKKLTAANKIILRMARENKTPMRVPLYSHHAVRKVFSESERQDFLKNIISFPLSDKKAS